MKNIFILITAIITLGSCSSTKLTGNPINDYLDAVIKDEKNKIIVVDKKISNKKTLGIFKGDFTFSTKSNSYEREGKPSALYNKQDWDKLNKKYSYDSIPEYWKKVDFKLADIIIVKNDVFIKNELYKEYDNKEYPKHKEQHIIPSRSKPRRQCKQSQRLPIHNPRFQFRTIQSHSKDKIQKTNI